MTPPLQTFLDHLEAAAAGAQKAEDEFRRSFAARIKALETERAFAFRRLNLLRVVAQAVAGAEHGDAAVGHAAGALRARLGWASDSEARSEVIARFAPVARAMFRELVPETSDGEHVDAQPASASEASTSVASTSVALAEFESWYVATHPVPFWVLFENVMPETPVVDF